MTDSKQTEELNEAELDQVTGGAALNLTRGVQQQGSKVIDYQDGHDLTSQRDGGLKAGNKVIVTAGGGNSI